MIDPNYAALLTGWTDELTSRSGRIRDLIGSRHWLTDGRHKEAILADLITRYLSRTLEPCTGFIVGNPPTRFISPEIDLFVADFANSPPLHHESGVHVARAEAVRATIEVKSTFSSTTAKDVLQHLSLLREVTESTSSDPWHGIVFFSTDLAPGYDYAKALLEGVATHCSKHGTLNAAVAVLGVCIIFISQTPKELKVRCFDAGRFSAGLWLLDLLAAVTSASTLACEQLDVLENLDGLKGISPKILRVDRQ